MLIFTNIIAWFESILKIIWHNQPTIEYYNRLNIYGAVEIHLLYDCI